MKSLADNLYKLQVLIIGQCSSLVLYGRDSKQYKEFEKIIEKLKKEIIEKYEPENR